jgi:hypothetical protein
VGGIAITVHGRWKVVKWTGAWGSSIELMNRSKMAGFYPYLDSAGEQREKISSLATSDDVLSHPITEELDNINENDEVARHHTSRGA